MNHTLIKWLGWKGAVLNGDPSVYDRWKWLSGKLTKGARRTLDAGCGSGCFSLYVAAQGNDVVGIDFGGPNIVKANERANILGLSNIRFEEVDLRKLDEKSEQLGQFDQILSFEVIEHLQNDSKLISDMSRLLKPGGRLILTTPYRHYRPLWGDKLSLTEDGGHVRWGYSHNELRNKIESVGMRVLSEDYISGVISQQLTSAMRRLNHNANGIGWIATLPFRVLQTIDGPITSLVDYPYLSIGIVAEKMPSV